MVAPIFSWLTVLFSAAAAILWFSSTWVAINAKKMDEAAFAQHEFAPAHILVGEDDFVETAIAQVRWNRWAAAASGLAALCQAIYTAVH